MKVLKWVIGIPVGAFAVLFLFFLIKNIVSGPSAPTESERWNNAAAECWKSYERKSLTPSEKIGIAKMCEDMEAKAK